MQQEQVGMVRDFIPFVATMFTQNEAVIITNSLRATVEWYHECEAEGVDLTDPYHPDEPDPVAPFLRGLYVIIHQFNHLTWRAFADTTLPSGNLYLTFLPLLS